MFSQISFQTGLFESETLLTARVGIQENGLQVKKQAWRGLVAYPRAESWLFLESTEKPVFKVLAKTFSCLSCAWFFAKRFLTS